MFSTLIIKHISCWAPNHFLYGLLRFTFYETTSNPPNKMHYCCLDRTSQTPFGLKSSKPLNTVSGCPHEYASGNVKMGLAGFPCNPDRVVTAYSTGRCWKVGLYSTFCGFTSKKQHILVLLQSGFHACCQNSILGSLSHIIKIPQWLPSKNNITTDSLTNNTTV